MNISLLSVGTEILLGDTVNTNLASLGQALYNNGCILSTEKTVPDDKKLIQDAVNELLERMMSLLHVEESVLQKMISLKKLFLKCLT